MGTASSRLPAADEQAVRLLLATRLVPVSQIAAAFGTGPRTIVGLARRRSILERKATQPRRRAGGRSLAGRLRLVVEAQIEALCRTASAESGAAPMAPEPFARAVVSLTRSLERLDKLEARAANAQRVEAQRARPLAELRDELHRRLRRLSERGRAEAGDGAVEPDGPGDGSRPLPDL